MYVANLLAYCGAIRLLDLGLETEVLLEASLWTSTVWADALSHNIRTHYTRTNRTHAYWLFLFVKLMVILLYNHLKIVDN